MSIFSTRNSDGASARAESANTISEKDWRATQDRALKANPKLRDSFSAESIASSRRGAANYRNRGQN